MRSPLTPDTSWRPQGSDLPIWGIIRVLAVSVGFFYFLLAANSTLMQAWFNRDNPDRSPYRLYALSNRSSARRCGASDPAKRASKARHPAGSSSLEILWSSSTASCNRRKMTASLPRAECAQSAQHEPSQSFVHSLQHVHFSMTKDLAIVNVVHACGKTNVLTYAWDLWQRTFNEVAKEYQHKPISEECRVVMI
jgi:hypothetical protein